MALRQQARSAVIQAKGQKLGIESAVAVGPFGLLLCQEIVPVRLLCDFLGCGASSLRLVSALSKVGAAHAKAWRLRAAYNFFGEMDDNEKVAVFPQWERYIASARAEAELLGSGSVPQDILYYILYYISIKINIHNNIN